MLIIKKTQFGKWQVTGAPAPYGLDDGIPPTFSTRKEAAAFCQRLIGRGEAATYQIAK